MKTEHTPWLCLPNQRTHGEGFVVQTPDGKIICEVPSLMHARLIAAAPELLENLRQLCEILESIGHDVTPSRNAIAKATTEEVLQNSAEVKAVEPDHNTIEHQIAREFSAILLQWAKEDPRPNRVGMMYKAAFEEFNRTGDATMHDWCDANVAMAEAYEKVTGTDPILSYEEGDEESRHACEQDRAICNKAWEIAIANQYFLDPKPQIEK